MERYCTAVFDVGKTNKKLLIFDSELKILDEAYRVFPEIQRDGVTYDDVEAIEGWFLEQLASFAPRYPIRAVSVSTHGATFAGIDDAGRPVPGVISYTTDPGEEFNREFYRTFGSGEDLQRVTATPRFSSLLNVAKGLFFIKRRFPREFARIRHVLGYPQYFGYVLTGKVGAEATYVGCHSYLWDFQRGRWSAVAEELGIVDRLPARVRRSWDVLGTVTPEVAARTGLGPDTMVTMGIHDSNASLLPYLIKAREDFVLDSTGTWCVIMHPSGKVEFQEEDIGKVVFYNLDAFTHPVKTTIFLGGMEFDSYVALFKELSGDEGTSGFDPEIYGRIVRERRLFILPELFPGTGQFPGSTARVVQDGVEVAFADLRTGHPVPAFLRDPKVARPVLILSLALQTEVALRRAGMKAGQSLYVEGGFRRNEAYNTLLAALYPSSQVSRTNMKEASAFGAAILGKIAVEGLKPEEVRDFFEIEFDAVAARAMPGLTEYRAAWHRLLPA